MMPAPLLPRRPERGILHHRGGWLPLRLLIAGLLAGLVLVGLTPELRGQPSQDVFATGLLRPRGLAFGPDGSLYVAEAGAGGERLVEVGLFKPHKVGRSGRVSRIGPDGERATLVDGLPSTITAYGEEVGPSNLAFLDGQLYLLTASGGWDVGDPEFHSGIFRVSPDGGLERIFDYSAHALAHPPRARLEDPRAAVPMGMPYGLLALDGRLYVTDGNWEQILAVTPAGQASRTVEYPISDRALTGLTAGPDGALYVAEFASNTVRRVTPDGESAEVVQKLHQPIDVDFDAAGRLYVLEYHYNSEQLGRALRVDPSGAAPREILLSGISRPTAMTFGPDGHLYISTGGSRYDRHGRYEAPKADGEVWRLRLPPDEAAP